MSRWYIGNIKDHVITGEMITEYRPHHGVWVWMTSTDVTSSSVVFRILSLYRIVNSKTIRKAIQSIEIRMCRPITRVLSQHFATMGAVPFDVTEFG